MRAIHIFVLLLVVVLAVTLAVEGARSKAHQRRIINSGRATLSSDLPPLPRGRSSLQTDRTPFPRVRVELKTDVPRSPPRGDAR